MLTIIFVHRSLCLSDILCRHTNKIISYRDVQVISVRRAHVWEDTKGFLAKPFVDWSRCLEIHFVGEPAIDGGGPKREFFCLSLHGAINDSTLFRELSPSIYLPVSSTHSLLQRFFFNFGRIVSVSLLHGVQGLCASPKWLYNYWLSGGVENLNISSDDCACPTTAKLLSKVV